MAYGQNKTPNLGKAIAEIKYLKDVEELVGKIWEECGPYFDKPMPPALRSKMQLLFNFDDSE